MSAAAEPFADAPWSLAPGDAVPAYQLPLKFVKNVVRTLSRAPRAARPGFHPRRSLPHPRAYARSEPSGGQPMKEPDHGRSHIPNRTVWSCGHRR
jgi:hypothetical protein